MGEQRDSRRAIVNGRFMPSYNGHFDLVYVGDIVRTRPLFLQLGARNIEGTVHSIMQDEELEPIGEEMDLAYARAVVKTPQGVVRTRYGFLDVVRKGPYHDKVNSEYSSLFGLVEVTKRGPYFGKTAAVEGVGFRKGELCYKLFDLECDVRIIAAREEIETLTEQFMHQADNVVCPENRFNARRPNLDSFEAIREARNNYVVNLAQLLVHGMSDLDEEMRSAQRDAEFYMLAKDTKHIPN